MARIHLLLLLLVCSLAALGCQGPRYVNIPAQPGDLAGNDPNSDTVRTVVAAAVHGILLEQPLDAPIAVSLPADASALTHADVARRVGSDAISPMERGVEPASQIDVREIRVRGDVGEVDAIIPGRGGVPRVVTVYVEWAPFAGWSAQRVQMRRAGAQDVLLSPDQPGPAVTP